MTLLSSLRSRIFLASALLTVLSIGVAIYLVSARVRREAVIEGWDQVLQQMKKGEKRGVPSPRAYSTDS